VENTDDPTGNTTVAYSPTLNATVSFQDQQYTSLSCAASSDGLNFGRLNIDDCGASTDIYGPFVPSDPTNDMFTSFPSNAIGTGIDVGTNYGLRMHTSPAGLDGQTIADSYYMGQIRIVFNQNVAYPVLHFAGLGAINGTTGFTTDIELVTAYDMYRISGNENFAVSANTIQNSHYTLGPDITNGSASGSVVIDDDYISVLEFNVYARGELPENYNGLHSEGDEFTLSMSILQGEPVNCCTTIFTNPTFRSNQRFIGPPPSDLKGNEVESGN